MPCASGGSAVEAPTTSEGSGARSENGGLTEKLHTKCSCGQAFSPTPAKNQVPLAPPITSYPFFSPTTFILWRR